MNALNYLHAAQLRLAALREELAHTQRRAAELALAVDCNELARIYAVGGVIDPGAGTLHQLSSLRLKAQVLERAVEQQRDKIGACQQWLLDEQLGASAQQKRQLVDELRATCARFVDLVSQLDEPQASSPSRSPSPPQLRVIGGVDDEPSPLDKIREAS